ncbi:unnamed protein product [Chrysoparadoxa australica]
MGRTKCKAEGCEVSANYSLPGQPVRFCAKHKEPGMCLPYKHVCSEKDCKSAPWYGHPNQTGSTRCKQHKLEGMVCKAWRRGCAMEGCSTRPHFGFPDKTTRSHCGTHKLEGMVYKGVPKDPTNRQDPAVRKPGCQAEGCSKAASIGAPGTRATRCSEHQLPGMFNWCSKCRQKGCTKTRRFGAFTDEKPSVCLDHRTEATPRDFRKGPQPLPPQQPQRWDNLGEMTESEEEEAIGASGRVSVHAARAGAGASSDEWMEEDEDHDEEGDDLFWSGKRKGRRRAPQSAPVKVDNKVADADTKVGEGTGPQLGLAAAAAPSREVIKRRRQCSRKQAEAQAAAAVADITDEDESGADSDSGGAWLPDAVSAVQKAGGDASGWLQDVLMLRSTSTV